MTTDRGVALLGGQVLDGTGTPARPGTVLVERGRITDVLPPGAAVPSEVTRLDCTGQVVAPGFIDAHSHADNVPFLVDDDVSKIEQGVTTEVVGNCGFSLAPLEVLHDDAAQALLRRLFPPIPVDWRSMQEMLLRADAAGRVTHHVPLVGHNILRIAAMGAEGRPADQPEVARMVHLLERALEEGAFGLSSGLIYPPGLFAEPAEVESLTRVLGPDRVYATHMRSETTHLFDSISESLAAAAGHCRLHVSHLKIADRDLWGRMPEVLATLDRARDRGESVTHDAYPYTAGSTMLTALLPPWFQDGGGAAVLARLDSEDARRRAERDIERDRSYENLVAATGWDKIVVSSTRSQRHVGQSLAALADQRQCSPFEALVMILREEELEATMVMHMMHEGDVRAALAHPMTAIGSDGLPPGTGGRPHPRTFGTFPRVLGHYVRDEQVLTLEEAVRRMTSLPADIFGLRDRGRISRHAAADLVTFDPDRIVDEATYDDPTAAPTGIGFVLQDGQVVVSDGRWQGVRHGQRLVPA
ncbi:N-acyl-D-amino-acid deacylase family protein [Ornithinimicrobium cavernae]|uniref:N-acyl-D-amino-acid deacylase family protein n=1 Tax=Ornithinimicrobium cavernae TaxID=2666047 RepID=UPI000D6983A3|nr:D-aminoacylase [Ornithinimicrobium cavernae]